MVDVSKGPTLIDLAEVYDTTLKLISVVFLTSSIGSVVGAFFSKKYY